jgi:LysR family glycine cleavage system transcriptional activator
MRLPSIRFVVAFETVAKHGSFGKAAAELNLTSSAVSHQIAMLEQYIGRALFERSPRGVELTAVGEQYRKSLSGVLAVIAEATENARAGADADMLRIHCAPTLASQWLMPRLPQFMTEHPEVLLRLTASPGQSNFLHDQIDVDIRYGLARWPNLYVETFLVEEVVPLIHPELKARRDIASPEDLLSQDLILCESNIAQWSQWFACNGIGVCPSRFSLRVDRAGLGLDAAAAQLGITLESRILADRFLSGGLLVPVFDDRPGLSVHQHHLVYPVASDKRETIRKFSDWLRRVGNADLPVAEPQPE